MEIPEVFKRLQPYIESILQDPALSGSSVLISCKTLTPEEAIGSPGRNDFPLQRAINYGSVYPVIAENIIKETGIVSGICIDLGVIMLYKAVFA